MIDFGRVNEVKRATIGLLSDLWLANYNANLSVIRNGNGVLSLFDRFDSVPAVVVAAGPSLDKNGYLLSKLAGKAIIVAVDTVYSALLDMGVKPDMVITLDPQPEITLFYENIDSSGTYLVAPTIVHPDVLSVWKGEVILYNKHAPDIPTLNNIAKSHNHLGSLIPGGSVLTVGLDLIFRMGAEPIGFAGQDLSYPPGVSAYTSNTRYASLDKNSLFEEKKEQLVTETDIFGREVTSLKSMTVTKQWMEWAFVNFKRKQKATFINLTEGGIVKGTSHAMSLDEWITRYVDGSKKRNFGWEIKKALGRKKKRKF